MSPTSKIYISDRRRVWISTVEAEHGSSFWSRGACVQNVLDSLVSALLKDENRKLIYVEKKSSING